MTNTQELMNQLVVLIKDDALDGYESGLLVEALNSFNDEDKVWLHENIQWPDML